MEKNIKISVRNLVEMVMRSGDIDSGFTSSVRALEGTLAHQKVQKSYGAGYQKEYSMKHKFDYEEFTIEVQGRADGVLTMEEKIIIDEIKSTSKDLEGLVDNNELHWAQAKCYGYFYCYDNNLNEIDIQLTYFHIETEERKVFKRFYTYRELREFFYDLIEKYIDWAKTSFYWGEKRDKSIEEAKFPFKDYRKGQRNLAVATYKTIEEGKKLYAMAPTGIGKTISTLFPSLKAMRHLNQEKIFYLTAKTITREIPLKSMEILGDKGLYAKSLVITSKEKICSNDQVKCNPIDCPYAKGHYDRVNDAIINAFEEENIFTRDTILEYSEKHRVCPFEFSLDLSLWADVIICDYNYVFNPQVYLRRFFDREERDFIFLVDEAHNLVDRGRDMFSAEINLEAIEGIKGKIGSKYRILNASISQIIDTFYSLTVGKNLTKGYFQKDEIDKLYYPIKRFMTLVEPWLIDEKASDYYEEVLEVYFDFLSFLRISELYDTSYVSILKIEDELTKLKLFCVDPAYLIADTLQRARASIFFSATLNPIDYYKEILGGKEDDYYLKLASPFPRENLGLFVENIVSTKYRNRDYSYGRIVEYIKILVDSKEGNYFVFFPSYDYMNKVYDMFLNKYPEYNTIIQSQNMNERHREDFLMNFQGGEEVLAFGVMGGMFSEGIDLEGERLIGAIIVGVGLPKISFEGDIILEYFQEKKGEGFHYAYTYPGMNKVLQSSGRVIRSMEDKGIVFLIDERYEHNTYKKLFPLEWNGYRYIKSLEDGKNKFKGFWKL